MVATFALPRSVSKPLLDPRDSLSLFVADYAARQIWLNFLLAF